MVSNPMQKKARNSFLLGVVITLIICLVIGALAYFLLVKKDETKKEEEGTPTYVYRLKTNVTSGETVDVSKVESILVSEKAVPATAFASKTKTTNSKGKEEWTDKGFPAGYKSKVDLKAGTVLSSDLLYQDEEITNDVRYVEYNMLSLPTTISEGDYIDIRLTFSNGQSLVVISKKEVKSILGDTIGLELPEQDILMMESAIVESYIMTASKLQAIQYVEPGRQEAAVKTYTPTDAVRLLMSKDANIVDQARTALTARFNSELRDWQNSEIENYSRTQTENIEAGIQKQIQNAKAAREAYLKNLDTY